MILDLQKLCDQFLIKPRGVIHIGAHEGSELPTYIKMRIDKALFIEANPHIFELLKTKISKFPWAVAINCAITDKDGFTILRVTSFDQSSSILKLKLHSKIYPTIKETHQIKVKSRRLDTLLEELKILPSEFNILNIDIQGAELFAFKGAVNVLKHIKGINTEVNFAELYEGCALVYELDEFLSIHGFKRVVTTTPYHPSWGDAFYVKS